MPDQVLFIWHVQRIAESGITSLYKTKLVKNITIQNVEANRPMGEWVLKFMV